MKAIILAGGFATRLWPITEKTAKPLLKIAGKEIISHIVERLPSEIAIIVSTNRVFLDDFRHWKAKSFAHRNITLFAEDSSGEKAKKGALAAVSFVITEFSLREDILVLAGDNLFFFDFSSFLQKKSGVPLIAAHNVGSRKEAKKFGVLLTNGNRVTGFQEKPEHPQSTLVSTGALLFPKSCLSDLSAFAKKNNDNLGGVFEYFLEHGREVWCFPFSENWFDIGSFSSFLEAHRTIIGDRVCDEGAQLFGKNKMRGSVFLGKKTRVKNCFLEDCILEDGVEIENTSLRNSLIGKNALIKNVDLDGVFLRAESVVVE